MRSRRGCAGRLESGELPELPKYNARPAWLHAAHAALDRAVWAAYGWEDDPEGTSDEEIPSQLLALNGERAGMSG